MKHERGVLIAGDSNLESFAGMMSKDPAFPDLKVELAPFGAVRQTLADLAGGSKTERDILILWTRPQAVSAGFNRLLEGEAVDWESDILPEVREFAASVLSASGNVNVCFLPLWSLPAHFRGKGLIDLHPNVGTSGVLHRMNQVLMEETASADNLFCFDTGRWLQRTRPEQIEQKRWYLSKVAFSNDLFRLAVNEFKSALTALSGQARKLVIVDLDDTLWGGSVGEVGIDGLKVGGHDPIGEAFAEFQKSLRSLKRRGVLLAISSKNDEQTALDALSRHPEMTLRPDDFVAWKIDWRDKAENVAELVQELNLGLQSVVFIDNSPAERDRVRTALPEVLVPDWPESPLMYSGALEQLRCFDNVHLTQEDSVRHDMYVADQQRQESRSSVSGVDDWLHSLNTTVQIERLNQNNLPRSTQLLNKTNQMNLSARRLTGRELVEWADAENRIVFTFRVSDKFGDSGLTGLLSVQIERHVATIVDFVVSCRVFNRGIEETMLGHMISQLRTKGVSEFTARYIPTEKNQPCLTFWKERSGFGAQGEEGAFSWNSEQVYDIPGYIDVREEC